MEKASCPLTEYLIKSGFQQRKRGYIDYAAEYSKDNPDDVIDVDYKKASPSQWWHLMKSWCARSKPGQTFDKRIKCGELWFWMAEVSGALTEDELKILAEEALKTARASTNDRKMPFLTSKSNPLILDRCYEKVNNIVEQKSST